MSLFKRLYNIAKAEGADAIRGLFDRVSRTEWDQTSFDEFNRQYEEYTRKTRTEDATSASGGSQAGSAYHGVPQQVVEDLAVFNLTPPSSMEEVRKARNREIKKYHSDKFINDPEKFETSKQIMQVYNAAYDRLKAYYQK